MHSHTHSALKKNYFGCFVVFQSVTGQNIDVQIAEAIAIFSEIQTFSKLFSKFANWVSEIGFKKFKVLNYLTFDHKFNSIDKTVTFHKKFANRIQKVTKCVTGLRNSNQTFHNTTLINKR